MTTAINTPSDIVNLALARIGSKTRIGGLYDGSLAAKKALDIYGQTRDALIRAGEWEFAERYIVATLQKQAPYGGYVGIPWSSTYPCLPWLFQYAYPVDCLKLRAVLGVPAFVPNMDPQYNVFSIGNDNSFTPSQKVILCNVPNAILTYTGQVTNPAAYDTDFIEEFAAELGRKLAPALAGLEAAKLAIQDEAAAAQLAAQERG